MKLNVKAFSLACAVWWGAGMFLLTWWLLAFEGRGADPGLMAMFYRGYRVSAWGSVVGLIWGFADGLVCGALVAWLYNRFADKLRTRTGDTIDKDPITP